MRITVLGSSSFAVATVRQLIERGHEVVLIEKDRDRIDELAETLDCGMIHGDGTLPRTLEEAYGDGAEAFMAITETDNVNILSAAVARSLGYERIITQLTRAELLPIIDQLGLGETITPHESVAKTLVEALEQRDQVSTVGVLKNQLRLMLVTVPEEQEACRYTDLDLPEDTRGIARLRDEEEIELKDDTEIEAGDRLLLLVGAEDHDDVLEMFSIETGA